MSAHPAAPLTPPLEALREVQRRLEAAGVAFALGASGLLMALGLERRVNDWDLTTDEPVERVRPLFAEPGAEFCGPSGIHTDHKLRLQGGAVELIVRMSLRAASGDVRIPALVSGSWQGVPLGSPEAWAVAYALMGREEKAGRLWAWLAAHGADAAAVERMLREPLPEDLVESLRGLPPRA